MIKDVHTVFGETVTVCIVEVEGGATYVGEAKMHPNDVYNEIIGGSYAAARAFRKASDDLTELADGLVNWEPGLSNDESALLDVILGFPDE